MNAYIDMIALIENHSANEEHPDGLSACRRTPVAHARENSARYIEVDALPHDGFCLIIKVNSDPTAKLQDLMQFAHAKCMSRSTSNRFRMGIIKPASSQLLQNRHKSLTLMLIFDKHLAMPRLWTCLPLPEISEIDS